MAQDILHPRRDPLGSVHGGGRSTGGLAPDAIYHNGKVFTANADHDIVDAVAILDGRIVAVGSDGDMLALASGSTERIDLEGMTMLPGFGGRIIGDCQPCCG